ncbi:MAG: hypothetical protein WAT25_16770, partial [Paracoccaceae bacterium]
RANRLGLARRAGVFRKEQTERRFFESPWRGSIGAVSMPAFDRGLGDGGGAMWMWQSSARAERG